MAADAMLSIIADLDVKPGEIPPQIHLKQGAASMQLIFRIKTDRAVNMETTGTAVIKGIKPDGSELFMATGISGITEDVISVILTSEQVLLLADVSGKYEGTVSVIDTDNVVSRQDYEDYDLVTVQLFYMDVQESAAK